MAMSFLPHTSIMAIAVCAAAVSLASPAAAQSVPTIDTEDATLGSADVATGGAIHPMLGFDLRNDDFARGNYDDDRADLDRLPVHAQIGVAIDLAHGTDGAATSWLVLRSSNGFHSPQRNEAASPRAWYESNNLAALVFTPTQGLRTAVVYTFKTSPNGVSDTTHEASLSFAYDAKNALGFLSPTFAVTLRPKGDHGVYTQGGIEPGFTLSSREHGPKLSLPVAAGIGWRGFYGRDTADRKFVSAGAALEQSLLLGGAPWRARLEAVALVRDRRLARLSDPDGETARVVPLVTLSLSAAY